jgi:hypothetical protein
MGESKKASAWGFREVAVLVGVLGLFFWISANMPGFIKEPVTSPANACINNMRQIEGAKTQWALEHNANSNGAVTINDIRPYIEHEHNNLFIKLDAKGNLPKCPSGGTYTIGKVGEPVTCSLGTTVTPAHVLP